jgi:uncharacterized heparinase superfamily protein
LGKNKRRLFERVLMAGKVERLHWLYSRWRAMSHPAEDMYRLQQFIRHHVLDRRDAGRFPDVPHGFLYKDRTNTDYSHATLAQLQPERSSIQRFPLLASTVPDLNAVQDWRRDFRSGKSSPVAFCGTINPQDFAAVGDVKYVAVLSRFHFLPFYAIDAVVHRDSASLLFIKRVLTDWNMQNPYLFSINWKTGIEIGIRALNLVYTRKVLSTGEVDDEVLNLLDTSIYGCFHYLLRHKSLYSSANNHLTAELLGLIVILAHFDHPDHERILDETAKLFCKELFMQNNADGGNREQSIQYQVEVLDAWLIGLQLLQCMDYPFDSDAVNEQLLGMGEFLRHFMYEDGTFIRVGDDDEGQYLFPYFSEDYCYPLSVLNSLELFARDSATNLTGDMDLRLYLMGSENWNSNAGWTHHEAQKHPKRSSRLFIETGYAFFNNEDSRLMMDVGEIGMRPLAAHGHSDILSFTLDYKGAPFIVDPGTFQYHSRTPFRQYFRSVKAHNTLSVNGLNQARSGGRMIWLKQPTVSSPQFRHDNLVTSCEAEHDGFVRQGVNVIHRRHIEYQRDQRLYVISDSIVGDGVYKIEFRLHFHPEVDLTRLDENQFVARAAGLELQLENPLFVHAELYKGSDSPPMGWYSEGYDKMQACWSLLLTKECNGPCEMVTMIRLL